MKKSPNMKRLEKASKNKVTAREHLLKAKRAYKKFYSTMFITWRQQKLTEKEIDHSINETREYRKLLNNYDKAEIIYLKADLEFVVASRLVDYEIALMVGRNEH